jgi:hypothetical protein
MTTTATAAVPKPILTTLHGREIGLAADRNLIVKVRPNCVSFSVAPGAANIAIMTMQMCDPEGVALAGVFLFDYWLSDSAVGIGVTTSLNTSELTASTGALMAVEKTEGMWRLCTDANGKCVVSHTDTNKAATYPCVLLRSDRAPIVATVLATGNFG